MAIFGSALTGDEDPRDSGSFLKNIMGDTGSKAYDATLGDPESRAALLQIGFNLMQPKAFGQTTGGQIAEGIGAGGEAVGRAEESDIKQQEADTKQQSAEDKLQIAELRLKNARNPDELTEYQRQVFARQDRTQGRADTREARMDRIARAKELDAAVTKATETRDSLVLDDDHPEKKRWAGKSDDQIRSILKAEQDAQYGDPATPTAPAVLGKPAKIKQNGYVYYLQPDGTYK